MLNWKILTVSFVMLTIGGVFTFASGAREGNGNITTVEISVSRFETIQTRCSVNVRIHIAPEYRLTISADSNLHERIEIQTKNNELVIGVKGRRKSFPSFSVDVYCPVLLSVSAAGNSAIELLDPLIAQTFTVSLAGDGSVTGAIECEKFMLNIYGNAEATLAGSASNAEINLTGNGTFNGTELRIINTTINFNGNAVFNTWTTDTLVTQGVGNASIVYKGDPVVEMKGLGMGTFTRIP